MIAKYGKFLVLALIAFILGVFAGASDGMIEKGVTMVAVLMFLLLLMAISYEQGRDYGVKNERSRITKIIEREEEKPCSSWAAWIAVIDLKKKIEGKEVDNG